MIPKGWKEYELAEICRKPIQYGIVQTGDHTPDGIPCLRVADFAEGAFDLSKMIRTSVDISNAHARTVLELSDLVIALRGTIGEPRSIPEFLVGANITRGLARLSPNEKIVSSRFLFWAIQSPSARLEFNRRANGSALQEIPIGPLRNMPLLIPEASEQAAISSRLDGCEQRIDIFRRLLFSKRRLRQGLMQQLLSGDRRFPGFTKPWGKIAIGDLLHEIDRPVTMRDDDLYRLASVRRNWGGLFEREHLHGRDIKTKNLREIKAGDFLIAHIQAAYGSLALVPPEFDGYKVSDLYSCLRARDPDAFDLRFFGYLAQQPYMTYLCRISSNGFFAERLRLNFMPELFLQQVIKVPPTIDEQRKIIATLELADQEVSLLERLLAAYQRQKRGLMQQLLTGKRRVRVPAATGEQR